MFRSKLPLLLLHLFIVVAVCGVEIRAQAVYGSISGTVADTAGAVVPGATITIRSIERNTTDVIESNDSGLYVKGTPLARHLRSQSRKGRLQTIRRFLGEGQR